jgi:anti-anti-sigma factor
MGEATVAKAALALAVAGIFEIELEDDTIIVVPAVDLGELEYERIGAGARDVLELLDDTAIRNVVLDFDKTDHCGSCALGFMLTIWKGVRMRKGRMALCNVSDHEQEILQITNLNNLWPICATRAEALEAVKP